MWRNAPKKKRMRSMGWATRRSSCATRRTSCSMKGFFCCGRDTVLMLLRGLSLNVERLMKPVRYSKSDAQVGDELLKSLESQGRWKLFSGQGDPVFSQTELAHIIATAKDCKEDFVRLVTPRFCELMKPE